MSEPLKRYEPVAQRDSEGRVWAQMALDVSGDWVRADEHEERVRALEAERDESIKNHADDMRHHARRFQAAEAERDALQQQLREVQTFDRDALELIREGVNRMPAFGVWKRELQARVLAKVVDALRDQPPAGQEAK